MFGLTPSSLSLHVKDCKGNGPGGHAGPGQHGGVPTHSSTHFLS